MSGPQHNEGIVVSGGSFRAHNVAAGRGARAEHHGAVEAGDEARLASRLAQLREAIAAHTAELDRADALQQSVDTVEAEMTAEQPNPVTVRGVLEGIAAHARSVAGVAQAVAALREAVDALL